MSKTIRFEVLYFAVVIWLVGCNRQTSVLETPLITKTLIPTLFSSISAKISPTPTITPTQQRLSTPTNAITSSVTENHKAISIQSKLLFSTNRDGNFEIYLMNADGSEQSNLTQNPSDDSLATWSPDGSHIAFVSERSGESDIFIMNSDGSDLRNLTGSPSIDTSPVWSPDGTQLAFISDRDGHEEVYVINPDSSQLIRLTNSEASKGEPIWSPDGGKIVFANNDFGDEYNWDIYSVNIANGETFRLTDDPAADYAPSWSFYNNQIYFLSERDRGISLYKINEDGSDTMRVIWPWVYDSPSWHPDGLTFLISWSPPDSRQNIYSSNSDGSEVIQLSDSTSFDEDSSPVWSPDGYYIAFCSNRDDNYEIYIMTFSTRELSRLTYTDSIDCSPAWQPTDE